MELDELIGQEIIIEQGGHTRPEGTLQRVVVDQGGTPILLRVKDGPWPYSIIPWATVDAIRPARWRVEPWRFVKIDDDGQG